MLYVSRLFHFEPPPEFRGLDPNSNIEIRQRNLPHWTQKGATYFVTYRLSDSIPKRLLDEAKVASTREAKDKDVREHRLVRKLESLLDSGFGGCLLRDPILRSEVMNAWRYHDGTRYDLFAFVAMPNHVHLLLRPTVDSLDTVLRTRKSFSARRINEITGKRGTVWQPESFDRIVRDAEHLWRCLQYVGRNPAKAGLRENEFTLWVKPEWREQGWDFLPEPE